MNQETTTSLIDAALASGAAGALDPEERRLQELVLAIRDDAPSPEPGFELRMNARVAAGFPRRRSGVGGRVRALLATRPQLTALGVAASLLLVLAVVLSGGSDTARPLHAPAAGGPAAAAQEAAPSASSAESGAAAPAGTKQPSPGSASSSGSVAVPAPVPPQPGGFVGGRNRKVERSASLVLAPTKDHVNEVGDQVIAVTQRYGGFVMSSTITSSAGSGSGGSFDLRVPARNLRLALHDLAALADVKSLTQSSNDVTAPFVNARTQLQELTAERQGLLRRLASAPTNRAAASIRAQLRIVNSEIQAQQSVLNDLSRRTNYASVSVTLEPKPRKAGSGGGGGGGIGNGMRDLRDSLVASANIALRVLGVALPIAVLVALFWGANGWVTRRRREAVLER